MKATRKVLSWIPGFSYDVIETSCCGMAGSFGLEKEHYEASMQMAEIALLPAVRGAAADAPIIANGFSCRHQIEHGSGRRARAHRDPAARRAGGALIAEAARAPS